MSTHNLYFLKEKKKNSWMFLSSRAMIQREPTTVLHSTWSLMSDVRLQNAHIMITISSEVFRQTSVNFVYVYMGLLNILLFR